MITRNDLHFLSLISRYTHEGMRLARDCDGAENGRVAIFSNPRGKRRLVNNLFLNVFHLVSH